MDSRAARGIYPTKVGKEGAVPLDETYVQHFERLPRLHGVRDGLPLQ